MTRINVIPPAQLTTKHLIAEYRELPRIFGLIEKWQKRGCPGPLPASYVLGPGHVRFFYDKAVWLAMRYDQLVAEMRHRGHTPTYPSQWHRVKAIGTTGQRDNIWAPRNKDLSLNLERINERLASAASTAHARQDRRTGHEAPVLGGSIL